MFRYVVIHIHQYGTSVYPLRSEVELDDGYTYTTDDNVDDFPPQLVNLLEFLEINFEPELDESLLIEQVDDGPLWTGS